MPLFSLPAVTSKQGSAVGTGAGSMWQAYQPAITSPMIATQVNKSQAEVTMRFENTPPNASISYKTVGESMDLGVQTGFAHPTGSN